MKYLDDKSLHDATMRYAAKRICLWRLCGQRACLKARACKGDVRRCVGLMADWVEAMEEEKRIVRGNFSGLEDEIKTFEQLRVYLAWREMLSRTKIPDRGYPKTAEEADRLRYDLARRLANLRSEHEQKERKQALRKEREAGGANSAHSREGGNPEQNLLSDFAASGSPLTRGRADLSWDKPGNDEE